MLTIQQYYSYSSLLHACDTVILSLLLFHGLSSQLVVVVGDEAIGLHGLVKIAVYYLVAAALLLKVNDSACSAVNGPNAYPGFLQGISCL